MEVVYLDQNKWIELARVHCGRTSSGPIADLYPQLLAAVESERVIFPLSTSHILETSKRNDPVSRLHVAETQAALSRGYVFRSRKGRLIVEVRAALQRLFGARTTKMPLHWVLAPSFMQAFEQMDELVVSPVEAKWAWCVNAFMHPARQYVDYIVNQDDSRRREAHATLAEGLSELVVRIEARRAGLVGEPMELRRRAYAVYLFMEHQDLFLQVLDALEYSIDQLKALGGDGVKALIENVPTLNVESEMAARLEAKTGELSANDVFDILSFYTAIPYSDRVVAEKAAISRAEQARLGLKYGVTLTRSLEDLIGLYQD